jgi:hypothetical protein
MIGILDIAHCRNRHSHFVRNRAFYPVCHAERQFIFTHAVGISLAYPQDS